MRYDDEEKEMRTLSLIVLCFFLSSCEGWLPEIDWDDDFNQRCEKMA